MLKHMVRKRTVQERAVLKRNAESYGAETSR